MADAPPVPAPTSTGGSPSRSSSPKKPDKAYLSIRPPGGKGKQRFTLQFNPANYTVTKSANWHTVRQTDNTDGGEPQFTGTEGRSLDLELLLDVTDSASGSVTKDVEQLFACCQPTDKSVQDKKPLPPTVVFGWGTTVLFQAYVMSVTAKFTMFRSNGEPTRASCSLKLAEIPTKKPGQNPTSGALASHRSHTVVAGDSLASLAQAEYGTPTMWRALADTNGIDDPMRVPSGTTLLVPPPDEAKALA
ncbi:MAG: LysM peptidoglycan-binding domain-containing protein [Acidimicrobiales bacterium]